MIQNSARWNEAKLQDLVCPEDIQIIKRIWLPLVKKSDIPTWIFTSNGQYSVKSGYHQLLKIDLECSSDSLPPNSLWKSIWALNAPPKIKHYWWRVLHNAIPVAVNVAHRNIKIPMECIFCGEANETIMHLLFQCRFAREIWELSPLAIPPGQFDGASSVFDVIHDPLSSTHANQSKDLIFPYIGWRIWKARNELLYQNKRWDIPDIINQALLDWRLWKEASIISNHSNQGLQSVHTTSQQLLPHNTSFYCCTDGSWINSSSSAGIGWALFNAAGHCLIKGSSSIEPTYSALETEAIALQEALLQVKRLNYQDVTFYGDSATLYQYLEKAAEQSQPNPGCLEIQGYLDDILALSKGLYHFKFIKRNTNTMADTLAKQARIMNSPFVVTWVL